MLMEKRTFLIASLIILVIGFANVGFGQTPAKGTPEARGLKLKGLLGSVEGVAEESPRVFKTSQGYLRFIGTPPSTHFSVDPNKWATPQGAADAFLSEHRNLFVNVSPDVGFDTIRVKTQGSRTYLRYQQTYAGLDVFGAEMIVQVNAAGGIAAVMSDIMRDTQVLDTGEVELTPTIDALTAQRQAVEWLAAQHEKLIFKATAGTLMIFSPSVVGDTGPTQLVWQTEVGNLGDPLVRELVLVNAHNGEIALHFSLFPKAVSRQVFDWPEQETYNEEDYPTEVDYVDKAFDYMEDACVFYEDHHGRDSFDDNGTMIKANVRDASVAHAKWANETIIMNTGWITDDTVGHEFTHGVTESSDMSRLYPTGQSGAIEEALCSMWGEWIDQSNTADDPYGNDSPEVKWLIAEDSIEGAVRSMIDPPEYEHPDRLYGPYWYYGEDDEVAAHTNNGVGNKLCYLLTDGDTFNGYTVSAMGSNTVADLFYECQKILTRTSEYYDLYYALTQAAINLDFSWGERVNIKEACEAVEICPDESDWELKGYWKLDDGSGSTAIDSSGYGNNGTLTNMDPETDWVTGKINGALDFDGTNDYVSLSPIPTLAGKSVTIAAWIKADDVSASYYHSIVSQYDPTEEVGYILCLYGDKPRLYINYWTSATSTESINTSDWFHIVGTYDNFKAKIYVDGGLKATEKMLLGEAGVNHDAYIGRGSTSYFDGKIDDVRIYNWAMDIVEIWEVMFPDTTKFRIKNSSGNPVAWFDDLGNLFLKGSKQTVWQDPSTETDEFIIESSTGPVAYIDDLGNLFLKGSFTQETTPVATGNDEFRVQDSNPADVAIVDASDGSVCIKGSLYQGNP